MLREYTRGVCNNPFEAPLKALSSLLTPLRTQLSPDTSARPSLSLRVILYKVNYSYYFCNSLRVSNLILLCSPLSNLVLSTSC